MTLYEIDREIMNLVDPETGEIADYEAFESLQMERGQKLENMALWVKDLDAEAKAIREEEKALAERRKSAENKAERLREYLRLALNGEKFRTAKVAVGYRKSTGVLVDMEALLTDPDAERYLVYAEPKADRKAIGDVLKAGGTVAGCALEERVNLSIR